jgi:hypothetical protein
MMEGSTAAELQAWLFHLMHTASLVARDLAEKPEMRNTYSWHSQTPLKIRG